MLVDVDPLGLEPEPLWVVLVAPALQAANTTAAAAKRARSVNRLVVIAGSFVRPALHTDEALGRIAPAAAPLASQPRKRQRTGLLASQTGPFYRNKPDPRPEIGSEGCPLSKR